MLPPARAELAVLRGRSCAGYHGEFIGKRPHDATCPSKRLTRAIILPMRQVDFTQSGLDLPALDRPCMLLSQRTGLLQAGDRLAGGSVPAGLYRLGAQLLEVITPAADYLVGHALRIFDGALGIPATQQRLDLVPACEANIDTTIIAERQRPQCRRVRGFPGAGQRVIGADLNRRPLS